MFAIVITTFAALVVAAIIGYEIYDWRNETSAFQKTK